MRRGMAAAPAARWWRGAVRGATRRAPRHYVYDIELDPTALTHAKFRAANPNHDPRKPPLYVGMTGLDPETRFERHKYGSRTTRTCAATAYGCAPISTRG